MIQLEQLLSSLQNVRRSGDGWSARCPAHDDHDNSLSVSQPHDGPILLKCHAGCPTEAILAARGWSWADLFPSSGHNGHAQQLQIDRVYDYTDETGRLLYQNVRFFPKDFRQRRPDGKGGWTWNLRGTARVLYRLPQVLAARAEGKTIYLVEGEKDADRLCALGLVATTSGGSSSWRKEFAEPLQGADVVLVPDRDRAGEAYAQKAAQSLHGKVSRLRLLALPLEWRDKNGLDVSDWLAAGGSLAELLVLAERAPDWTPPKAGDEDRSGQNASGKKDKEPSQAQILIALAAEARLFHAPDGTAYALVQAQGHSETWPLRTRGFRQWIVRRFFDLQGKPPGAQALQDALGVLEAQAAFDGPCRQVFLRVAELEETIYLDLCNEQWEAVEVSASGWRVVRNPPVSFRRVKGMLPLPQPQRGGQLEELRRHVNASDETAWQLCVGWLVAALRPRGPYPVMVLRGEQGAAKSTTARMLRALVDPSTALLRSSPRDERDLAIAASNAWVMAFDNLSYLPDWLSDALCRLSTGGGFSTRELFSDTEEVILDYMRPVLINGIEDVASRDDLCDRALVASLPPIHDESRRTERQVWAGFEQARPGILGGLLDALSAAVRRLDQVELPRLPRMADFAEWVVAAEPALPWQAGSFLETYDVVRKEAVSESIDSDLVASALVKLHEQSPSWEGTARELGEALAELVSAKDQESKAWPRTPRALSGRLRRSASFLRRIGIEILFRQEAHTRRRLVLVRTAGHSTDPTDPTDPIMLEVADYKHYPAGSVERGSLPLPIPNRSPTDPNRSPTDPNRSPTDPAQVTVNKELGSVGSVGIGRMPSCSTPHPEVSAWSRRLVDESVAKNGSNQ